MFDEREAEYTRLPAKVQLAKEPYIKGKIMVYEKLLKFKEKTTPWKRYSNFGWNGYDYDEKFKNIYAKTPEEIQTIVLNDCQQKEWGNYEITPLKGEGAKKTVPGFGWRCEVTLIDMTIPAVVYRKTFESEREELGPIFGRKIDKVEMQQPTLKIERFIGDLPRN